MNDHLRTIEAPDVNVPDAEGYQKNRSADQNSAELIGSPPHPYRHHHEQKRERRKIQTGAELREAVGEMEKRGNRYQQRAQTHHRNRQPPEAGPKRKYEGRTGER